MKNLLLVFSILLLFSCQEETKKASLEVVNNVEVKVEKRNEVYIAVNDTINSFFTNLFVEEMQDKPDMIYLGQKVGKKSLIIPTDNSIEIKGGDPFISILYQLELKKGDSLLINLEKININKSKQAEYPTFTILNGDKPWTETNFDYLLYKYNIDNNAIVINENNSRQNKYESEKVYQNAIKLLDSLKANSSISDSFYAASRMNQKLKFANYEIRKAKLENTELNIDSLNITLNNEELFENKEYLSFLRELVLYQYFKDDKKVLPSTQFDFVSENDTFLNEETKQPLLNAYLKSIFFIEKQMFAKYLKKFNTVNKSADFKNKWQFIVDQQKENSKKLNTENRNIGILTNLINDNELTFEEVLSNHSGKVVLVDFWASWCAPCRKEMPFLNDLKSKFDKTKFKIIEISIDTDYSAWVRASKIENLSNEADSYIISGWAKSNLYKNYKIQSIPRYLVFGKDGKIIDDNAPRPSESQLADLIKASM